MPWQGRVNTNKAEGPRMRVTADESGRVPIGHGTSQRVGVWRVSGVDDADHAAFGVGRGGDRADDQNLAVIEAGSDIPAVNGGEGLHLAFQPLPPPFNGIMHGIEWCETFPRAEDLRPAVVHRDAGISLRQHQVETLRPRADELETQRRLLGGRSFSSVRQSASQS